MHDDEVQPADEAFWADLANVVQTCQESSGNDREIAWRALRGNLSDWTRAFVHRKGVRHDDEKEEFCDFMLS